LKADIWFMASCCLAGADNNGEIAAFILPTLSLWV
jgi:hypothetical protein